MKRPVVAAMKRRPRWFHYFTPETSARLFRSVARRVERDGVSSRMFVCKRLTIIWETKTPPPDDKLLPSDRTRTLGDVFRNS